MENKILETALPIRVYVAAWVLFSLIFLACGQYEVKGRATVDHNINVTVCDRYEGDKWDRCMDKILSVLEECKNR